MMSGCKLDNDSRRSPLVATSILFLDFVKAAALLNPHSTKYVEGAMAGKRLGNIGLYGSKGFESSDDWFLDSGATTHLSRRNDWLEKYNCDKSNTVGIANGAQIQSTGCGTVKIPLATKKTMIAKDVHHAPELAVNLLSVSRIASHGKSLIFDINGCRIVDIPIRVPQSHVLGTASQHQGLHCLDRPVQFGLLAEQPHDLWHRQLGHLSRGSMKLLLNGMVTGIPKNSVSNIDCVTCVKGKQCRLSFPKLHGKRATNLLDIVHSGICGPTQVRSFGGARYFISFIDDFSRESFIYFLKNKNDALQKFKEFVAFVERKTSRKVKCLRTDNGREYVNDHFAQFLTANGIRHERSVPDTPQQNGIAERLNPTIVKKARTMLIDAGLSTDLWAEAIGTANYLRNRCPTKALRNVRPGEAWSGRKPNLSHLKIFGCLAMECIFVGYSETSKGYRTINRFTKKLNIARDVVFLESSFPGTRQTNAHLGEQEKSAADDGEEVIMWKLQGDKPSGTEADKTVSSPIEARESPCCDTMNENAQTNEGRPKRNRVPNRTVFNSDFVVYEAGMHEGDPVSYRDAIRRPDAHDWLAAVDEELASHHKNHSWEVCSLPEGKKAIKSKWVFKTKCKIDGTIERRKARLVAKVCSQKPGINYEDTFAPTVGHASLRLLLSLAVQNDLEIIQMDVVTALLNPKLKEEIYMELPEGVAKCQYPTYCRLKKSIYGLKQSSRAWYDMLDGTLQRFGMKRLKSEPCVYYRRIVEKMLIIGIYVDDLLILSNDQQATTDLKRVLHKQFEMKDLGKAHWCLGIRINQEKKFGTLSVDQARYIDQILGRFGVVDCKVAKTPLDPNQLLSKEMSRRTEDERMEMKKIV
ncbi:hypothetical protein M514_27126 [Trichuris suis]|uniref:Integrase catalytic domain-containing protein n=1 Tax=Trichuris suis TaxID=68888 RepID=A0A085MTZ9_9BILA|nr:hypothetical protein M514_27126 [Trichuris suis]